MLNWFYINKKDNGDIIIYGHANGDNLPRERFIGYSLEGAIREYRKKHGLERKHMERIYL